MSKVILLDLMNLAFRMHYRSDLRASTGVATGITHGCLTVILMLARQYPKSSIVVCIDGPNSWRRKMNVHRVEQGRSPEGPRTGSGSSFTGLRGT